MDPNLGSNTAFTVASKNYLRYAISLRHSFLRHNPDFTFHIVLMDKFASLQELEASHRLQAQGISIINFEDVKNVIDVPHLEQMLFRFDILEMNTTIKPFMFEYFFKQGAEKVFFIDPDIYFLSSLDAAVQALDRSDVVLTPHILTKYTNENSDETFPNDRDILLAGIYNLGFCGLRNSSEALGLLRWWQNNLSVYGHMDVGMGMHTDQNWMNLAGIFCEKTTVLRHKGYNVAYWNLHERSVQSHDGQWLVEEDPLVFFHFSGFPSQDLDKISTHQRRQNLSKHPQLRPLFEEYKTVLAANDVPELKNSPYFYDFFRGTDRRIPSFSRRWVARRPDFSQWSNPFRATADFPSYFMKTVQEVQPSGLPSIYHHALQTARRWGRETFVEDILNVKDPKVICDGIFKTTGVSAESWLSGDVELSKQDSFGLNLFGGFEHQLGTSIAGRFLVQKLYNLGVPFAIRNMNNEWHPRLGDAEMADLRKHYCEALPHNVNLAFYNADTLEHMSDHFRNEFQGRKTLGLWWWEFDDHFPFQKAFEMVDGVIACSEFVATALRKAAPQGCKVFKWKYPYMVPALSAQSSRDMRQALGFSSDDFIVYFNFDFCSSYERKNPEAVISTFSRAFKHDRAAKLLLKISNANLYKDDMAALMRAIQNSGVEQQVRLSQDVWSHGEVLKMMAQSDVYLSLHRSEGLGAGMLEAMSVGLPVVATSYGGNLDFMNSENSLLVDWKPIAVQKDFGPYRQGWTWADPQIQQAELHLRRLFEDKQMKIELGRRGKTSIVDQFRPEALLKDLVSSLPQL